MNNTVRHILTLARYVVPLLILGWLLQRLWQDDRQSIETLYQKLTHWPQLVLALLVYLLAILGTFWRWYLLVVALRLPFRKSDACRLGFIGYLLQFVSLGSVGGDVFKAVFVAREQPSRKPEAVATVLIDRAIGLFGLMILACITFGLLRNEDLGQLRRVRTACFALATIGTVAFAVAFWTQISIVPLAKRLRGSNFLRTTLLRVQVALDLYRDHRLRVLTAVLASVTTHFLHALALYLAATAVFPRGPSLLHQMGIWVVAATVAAIPIAPAGLGTFDVTYTTLYETLAPAITVTNEGLLVALLYRVMCLVAAAIGIAYFWMSRRELKSLSVTAERKA